MQLHGELLADNPSQRAHADSRQLADGLDAIGREPLLRLLPYPQEIPHGKRPHLGRHFIGPKGVHLVRLLEVRSHLCEELVGADTHIHREPQRVLNLVFQLRGHRNCILRRTAKAHINKTLIDGELLQNG